VDETDDNDVVEDDEDIEACGIESKLMSHDDGELLLLLLLLFWLLLPSPLQLLKSWSHLIAPFFLQE
jgi:hypothetical protein